MHIPYEWLEALVIFMAVMMFVMASGISQIEKKCAGLEARLDKLVDRVASLVPRPVEPSDPWDGIEEGPTSVIWDSELRDHRLKRDGEN